MVLTLRDAAGSWLSVASRYNILVDGQQLLTKIFAYGFEMVISPFLIYL